VEDEAAVMLAEVHKLEALAVQAEAVKETVQEQAAQEQPTKVLRDV
jgi:hypothetical protein